MCARCKGFVYVSMVDHRDGIVHHHIRFLFDQEKPQPLLRENEVRSERPVRDDRRRVHRGRRLSTRGREVRLGVGPEDVGME